jgi:hypothetical protein
MLDNLLLKVNKCMKEQIEGVDQCLCRGSDDNMVEASEHCYCDAGHRVCVFDGARDG